MEKMMNNNVVVRGTVVSDPEYSHEVFAEKFYKMFIGVERKSGTVDRVPVLVSERLWDVTANHLGEYVRVEGQFRSQNMWKGEKSRLELFVFAKEICAEQKNEFVKDENQIALNGFLCKPPVYRTTPFGREICDVLLAVNRAYGKSDYIPCIFWGRNAAYFANKQVGDQVQIEGRVQSREYGKKNEEGIEFKTAYEVSVMKFAMEKEKEAGLEK